MVNYSIRRILATLPVLIGVLVVTFLLGRAIPGDPCRAMLGEKATQEICDRFMEEKGYNKPLSTQLGIYLIDVAQGDFGQSVRYNRSVVEILVERLPMTAELATIAFTLAIIVGIPAGIVSAVYRNSPIDVITMVSANIGVSMPVFWLGLMLAYLFAILLKDTPFWLPPSGRLTSGIRSTPFYEVWEWGIDEDNRNFLFLDFISNFYLFNSLITFNFEAFWDAVKHLILPSMALSTIPLSIIARMTRSSLLEVLGSDYVRTARAKGLKRRKVILKHAFRNALLPLVTVMGLQLGGLLSGAVLTETIFGLTGIGRTLFESITARDYPVIQAVTFMVALIYVVANLAVDLSYGFLDPRIRYE